MDKERKAFENRFDTAVKEVLALTQDRVGAGKSGTATLWEARTQLLAYIDIQTGELFRGDILLTWQLTEEECRTREMIFDLDREQVYLLKVRESLPHLNSFTDKGVPQGRELMVVEVVKRNCRDKRLEEILVEYQKPVTFHPDGCGELLLDKSLGMFEGECQWNGETCMVRLDVDDQGLETARDAAATLAKLFSDCQDWDNKARRLAASELVDNANDWQENEEGKLPDITEEDFARRLRVSELCVSTDGDFEIYYDDDDMFWGHVIIVRGNIEDGLTDACIAG